ncbi:hypothetical protein B6U84_04285 [Candidatus Bathyarchaeota archaeon ex4484_40]|nr:MAG: hypothetical protein B6U84_04285 [Candidatus Bathyarchaeota archaeon ex4484_40]
METKLKVLAVSAILVMVLLSSLSVLPLVAGATSNVEERQNRRLVVHIVRHRPHPRAQIARQFFRGASAVTIEGSVAAYHRNILVLDSNGENINVILLPIWRYGADVNGVSIVTVVAYEIENISGGYTLYAVTPFNVRASNE